jgi:hypothetical protein
VTPQARDGGLLPFVQHRLASPGDIFLVSFGSWHRWSQYGDQQQYQNAIYSLGGYYQVRLTKVLPQSVPKVLYLTVPKRLPLSMLRLTKVPELMATLTGPAGQQLSSWNYLFTSFCGREANIRSLCLRKERTKTDVPLCCLVTGTYQPCCEQLLKRLLSLLPLSVSSAETYYALISHTLTPGNDLKRLQTLYICLPVSVRNAFSDSLCVFC